MSLPHVNEIALVGRLSGEPAVKTLTSGRSVYEWRLVVLRPADRPGAHDTIDCVSYAEDVQKAAAGWRKGDVLALRGALRRHFWQSAATGSAVSRYDVEVWEAQLLTPATNLEPAQPP
jgi:single-strand DNA-binding protein